MLWLAAVQFRVNVPVVLEGMSDRLANNVLRSISGVLVANLQAHTNETIWARVTVAVVHVGVEAAKAARLTQRV